MRHRRLVRDRAARTDDFASMATSVMVNNLAE